MKHEPAAIIGLLTAVLALLVAYGLLDLERAGAWEALLIVAVPLAQGLVTRFFVWCPRSVERATGTTPFLHSVKRPDA